MTAPPKEKGRPGAKAKIGVMRNRVLALREREPGISISQTAKRLGITSSSVKYHIRMAKRQVQLTLDIGHLDIAIPDAVAEELVRLRLENERLRAFNSRLLKRLKRDASLPSTVPALVIDDVIALDLMPSDAA